MSSFLFERSIFRIKFSISRILARPPVLEHRLFKQIIKINYLNYFNYCQVVSIFGMVVQCRVRSVRF